MAQGLREIVGDKHDQSVIANPFSVAPGAFRYYKFDLPDGSTSVALVGQFTSEPDRSRTAATTRPNEPSQSKETGIELYVLSEPGFAVWQKGYGVSPVYDSGRVAQADVQVDLPNGAGVYYLVFSNKFPAATAQRLNATLMLHYKSWIPDWIRRIPRHFE